MLYACDVQDGNHVTEKHLCEQVTIFAVYACTHLSGPISVSEACIQRSLIVVLLHVLRKHLYTCALPSK